MNNCFETKILAIIPITIENNIEKNVSITTFPENSPIVSSRVLFS